MRVAQLSWTVAVVVAAAVGCGGTTFVGEEEKAGTGGGGKAGSGSGGSSGAQGGSSTGGTGGAGGTMTGGAGGAGSGGSGSVGGSDSVGGSGGGGGSGGVGGSIGTGGSINTGGSANVGGSVAGSGATGGTAAAAGTGNGGGGGGALGGSAGISGGACTDPDGASIDGGVTVQSTTVGLTASLTDYCDDSGNLVEHYCEYTTCVGPQRAAIPVPVSGGAGGIGPCDVVPTGNVLALPVDCAGRCKEGMCERFCANFEETFTVFRTTMGGPVTLQHQSGQFVECSITAEQNGFQCSDASLAGRQMTVVALGNCTPAYFTMGVDYAETSLGQDCSYSCTTVAPPPEI